MQVGVSILDEPESNIVEIYKHLKISDMNATLEEKDKEDEVIGF